MAGSAVFPEEDNKPHALDETSQSSYTSFVLGSSSSTRPRPRPSLDYPFRRWVSDTHLLRHNPLVFSGRLRRVSDEDRPLL